MILFEIQDIGQALPAVFSDTVTVTMLLLLPFSLLFSCVNASSSGLGSIDAAVNEYYLLLLR